MAGGLFDADSAGDDSSSSATKRQDFNREQFASAISSEAAKSVFIGTSSWKYPGWIGTLYDEQRYLRRSRFSKAAFERECLREYAETFSTVCVDAGFYNYPQERQIEKLVEAVPSIFRFGFKVTENITVKSFPKLPRHAGRGGQQNEDFLNAEKFKKYFLNPLRSFQDSIGVLIFSFTQFSRRDFQRGRDFLPLLDRFLGELPNDCQYAMEIRNRNFLQDAYFEILKKHGVAHVYNSWTRMPSVSEQLALSASKTTDFTVGRFLLKPGRGYEEAVKKFAPYRRAKAVYEEGRRTMADLIKQNRKKSGKPSYIFVNNRLEGNSLQTISAVLDQLAREAAQSA
ncbi:MAG: DUF72 domain-containing protein [Chthoniobacterales bacterium]